MLSKFVLLILMLIACTVIPLEISKVHSESVSNSSIPMNVEAGADNNYTLIFDGNALDGWKMAGKGNFAVTEDKSLKSGGQGILWYTKAMFDNFVLKLDWKVSGENDNSGVFVRFPSLGNDPKIAVKEGYEVQIDDAAGNPLHQTGAIYDYSAPSKLVSNPPGNWNTMEIKAINQSYSVFINGEKVNDFVGDRKASGYIGFQSHDDNSQVLFRNIYVKKLPQ